MSKSSSLIPIPVSSTENTSFIPFSPTGFDSTLRRTYPLSVNLIALFTRLIIICLSRWLSPYIRAGKSGVISYKSSTGLSPILFRNIIAKSWSIDIGSYFSSIISSFPDSIFEKSRMSLIIVSSASPEFFILLRYSLIFSGTSSLSNISVIPTIAFIGVLIS